MVSMNRLSTKQRAAIVACLMEGNSVRATVRMTGAARNTVTKLLVDLGRPCREYQDGALVNLPCTRIQCDVIWSFVGSKAKNVPAGKESEYGDVWTWTTICADTKLIPSWWVGGRDYMDAAILLQDLHSRLFNRLRLSTEGWTAYAAAVEDEFGSDIDYAQIIKKYGKPDARETRYIPAVCTGTEIRVKQGDHPDPAHISTSYVERQNLTMPMSMRRFNRLTNAFSKKIENLEAAISLHFMHYNFARPHMSLKANGYQVTPAMAAGVADHVWTVEEILGLLDACETRTKVPTPN
jgi:IS1 family transposase